MKNNYRNLFNEFLGITSQHCFKKWLGSEYHNLFLKSIDVQCKYAALSLNELK